MTRDFGVVEACSVIGFDDPPSLSNKGEDVIDVDTDKEGDRACDWESTRLRV